MAAYEGKRFKGASDDAARSGRGARAHAGGRASAGAGSHARVDAGAAAAPRSGSGAHAAPSVRPGSGSRSAARAGGHFAGSDASGSRAARSSGTASPRVAGASRAAGPVTPQTSAHRAQQPVPVRAGRRSSGAAEQYAASAESTRGKRGRRSTAATGTRFANAAAPTSARNHGGSGGHGGSGARKGSGGRSKRNVISYVLIGVGVLLLLVAAGIFIWAQLGYRQAAETYQGLEQYVTVDSEGDGVPVVDWDALKAQSEDIVAWIYVPGTNISYPVVQGDTNDEYLRALPDGTWNNNGSIMLDCDQTAPGMVDQQTTVYGHHMNDGSMFQAIEQTLDQSNFDAITTVYYLTPETTYKLTPLFTARVSESYVEARQANFGDAAALQKYLTDLRGSAQAEASDVDERLAQTDQVLSLVTCSGLAPADHRAVMVCTIAEEIPATQASAATE